MKIPLRPKLRPLAASMTLLTLFAAIAAGCANEALPDALGQTEQPLVFDGDSRSPLEDATLADAIGTLRAGHGTCTAFAIGRTRIATARHCVGAELRANPPSAATFTSGAGDVAAVLRVADEAPAFDYAELEVDRTFARPFATSAATPGDEVRVVGYDLASGALAISAPCTIGAAVASWLAPHRCDTLPGASGGPVLRGDVVVGLHLGYAPSLADNVALRLDALTVPTGAGARATEVAIDEETTCTTNCSSSCQVGYNYPCPTWRNPGRMCHGSTLDPACKARCEVEREFNCRTGLNGCDLWEASPVWVQARETLAAYGRANGLTAQKCVDIVELGGTAAGVAGAAYTAYVEGLASLLQVNPVSAAISMGVQHGAKCACRKALP